MKYWRGYLVAGIAAACAWGFEAFSEAHSVLVDMIYPYVSRMIQDFLAQWSASADFCVWQVLLAVGVVLVLASVVLMILFKWNPVQWFGWVLASACMIGLLNTVVYGLNNYAGDLAEDIRLEDVEYKYDVNELKEAAFFYRDKANELAAQVSRDGNGDVQFSDFDQLAVQAADGFEYLTYEKFLSVFAGSTVPVKELGWSDYYSSRGITGMTVALTGEAAVNPQIPDMCLPFAMCHEMAHRMSIAIDRDADFAAFLACSANSSVEFQYSAYFTAFVYCYDAMKTIGTSAGQANLKSLEEGISSDLQRDLVSYNSFFGKNAELDSQVCDLLVIWHIQEYVLPLQEDEEQQFDPLDENAVDLTTTTVDRQ